MSGSARIRVRLLRLVQPQEEARNPTRTRIHTRDGSHKDVDRRHNYNQQYLRRYDGRLFESNTSNSLPIGHRPRTYIYCRHYYSSRLLCFRPDW